MKRFFAHLSYLLLVLPLLLIVVGFTYCDLAAETVEQYGVLYTVRVEDIASGEILEEEYQYRNDYTEVTCTYSHNGEETETKTWAIEPDDPLITDTYEVLPHPIATAAKSEREENGSHVTIRYFDAAGNPEGWSEVTYNSFHRLGTQHDFAADGTPIRVTTRGYFISSYSVLELGDTKPTE